MRSAVLALSIAALSLTSLSSIARADGTCTTPATAPSTWGVSPKNTNANANLTASPTDTSTGSSSSSSSIDESPVSRARDLLARARLLDEVATSDEKAAVEIAARLPTLRGTAKTARDKADHASGDDRETLVSRAEDLEADVAISEAETSAKHRAAIDNRRVARELRTRAVRMVREAPIDAPVISSCDPPYRYTADGRKTYRVECLK